MQAVPATSTASMTTMGTTMATFSLIRAHINAFSFAVVLLIVVAVPMQLGTAVGTMSQTALGQTANPEDALTDTAVHAASVTVAVSLRLQSLWTAVAAMRTLFGMVWLRRCGLPQYWPHPLGFHLPLPRLPRLRWHAASFNSARMPQVTAPTAPRVGGLASQNTHVSCTTMSFNVAGVLQATQVQLPHDAFGRPGST